jgi:hypothetical protein
MIAHKGESATKTWLEGVKANLLPRLVEHQSEKKRESPANAGL